MDGKKQLIRWTGSHQIRRYCTIWSLQSDL